MSSESTSKDQNGEWVMPEPIFRSSEGRTPGAKPEAVTDELEITTPTIEGDIGGDVTGVFDETAMNHVRATPAKPVEEAKAGGCAASAMMTIVIIALISLTIIAAAIYFFYYSPANAGNTF